MTVAASQMDEKPVGGGERGVSKSFTENLTAATPKNIYFGRYKLSNVDDFVLTFGVGTNGSSDVYIGAPDTTLELDASGEFITLTDSSGGPVSFTIKSNNWTEK